MARELPTGVGYDLRGNESSSKSIVQKEIESSAGIKYILPAQFLFQFPFFAAKLQKSKERVRNRSTCFSDLYSEGGASRRVACVASRARDARANCT